MTFHPDEYGPLELVWEIFYLLPPFYWPPTTETHIRILLQ